MPLALDRALDDDQLAIVTELGRAADRAGAKLWAVGGTVRDTLLGKRVLDVDLTSETPVGVLGHALADELDGTLTSMTRFGTAKLRVKGHTFDLATTRTEAYPEPAILPVVEPGRIEDDLVRRDFTINAMAVSLAPDDFGEVLDLHGGQRDLDAGLIRVIHGQSFRDDPTRTFRAIRYAVRLRFRLEHQTAGWMRRDALYAERLTPARVRHEIERIVDEEDGASMLAEAHRRGLLAIIHPSLGTPEALDSLRQARRARLRGLELLAALTYPLSPDDAAAAQRRLGLSRRQATVALAASRLRLTEPNIRETTPSQIDALVGGAPLESLEAMAAVAKDRRARLNVRTYLQRLSFAGRHLNGDDLAKLGVPQGPAMGLVLRSLRAAELDGQVRSRAGAERFVKKLIKEE